MPGEGDVGRYCVCGEPAHLTVLAAVESGARCRACVEQVVRVEGVERGPGQRIGIQPHPEQGNDLHLEARLFPQFPHHCVFGQFCAVAESTGYVPVASPRIDGSAQQHHPVAVDHQASRCRTSIAVVGGTAVVAPPGYDQVDASSAQGAEGEEVHGHRR